MIGYKVSCFNHERLLLWGLCVLAAIIRRAQI